MAIQKKHGKGRLDKYYHLAKEKGYRARAAFKLIQLNKKYSFLQQSRCLIDLCAAPGSWMQVAAETMPVGSLIVGVDLAPIKPIPRTISFQGDITTDKTRAIIRGHLKTWKADTVVHDGAPNVGTAWLQDAFSQNELVLSSLHLATDFLAPGGTFVTKVFRSKDSNKLEWIFKQLFGKVEQTKPPSSRNVSAETFYVCRGYKAPKHLDPRFLDPKYAFAEVEVAAPNNEARVFNPEIKKRKREGYEEGDYTQFHESPASEFIQTSDPIKMLGEMNKLSFEQTANGDLALATLEKLPETTEEIRICCADLKVLGRKEFKMLLRWRLKVREKFGFSSKAKKEILAAAAKDEELGGEEVAQVDDLDEELALQEELQKMKDMKDKGKRKERRKDNERKQKNIVRMQMNMTTPMEIGMEQAGPNGEGAMFKLSGVDKAGMTGKLARGKMHSVSIEAQRKQQEEEEEDEESEAEDEDGDELERQLDNMYEQYQSKREERDAKARAKRARKEHRDDEFEGFSDKEKDEESGDELVQDDASDLSSDDEDDERLVTDLNADDQPTGGLTKRASLFFDQDLFKDIDGLEGLDDEMRDRDSGIDMQDSSESPPLKAADGKTKAIPAAKVVMEADEDEDEVGDEDEDQEEEDQDEEDAGFEVVKRGKSPTPDFEDEDSEPEKGRPNIDIITAEAMTLAHQLATGKKTKHDLMDENFNKYTLRDVDGLPEWFLDDEDKHSKPHRPITAAAAAAIKEKLRALNARPIKKVREAKARKAMRAATRLEKLKRKSALLAENDDMTEKDKAGQIQKLMAKAKKSGKQKKPVKVVVARGGNRGRKGRPGGVKGKYKMVDPRLKKDVRAEKRLKKKHGK